MAGFSLSNLFGGMTDGLKKGLKYDKDFMGLMAWAVKTDNAEAITKCGAIAAKHAEEIAHVLGSGGMGLIFNGDPFSASRKLTQDAIKQFGSH